MKLLIVSVLLFAVVNVKCCKQDPCATVRCAGCVSDLKTCTYRCGGLPKPCLKDPCMWTKCTADTTCVVDPITCRSRCVPALTTPCKENPCTWTKCSATTTCVVNPQTCNSECVPIEPLQCIGNPCSGVTCGATASCSVNSNTCQPECVPCNNVMDPCWTCLDRSKCTVEGCVGTCHDYVTELS